MKRLFVTRLNNNNKILLIRNISNYISFSPQITYKLIEAGRSRDILQIQGLSIDGLNNRENTTIQYIVYYQHYYTIHSFLQIKIRGLCHRGLCHSGLCHSGLCHRGLCHRGSSFSLIRLWFVVALLASFYHSKLLFWCTVFVSPSVLTYNRLNLIFFPKVMKKVKNKDSSRKTVGLLRPAHRHHNNVSLVCKQSSSIACDGGLQSTAPK